MSDLSDQQWRTLVRISHIAQRKLTFEWLPASLFFMPMNEAKRKRAAYVALTIVTECVSPTPKEQNSREENRAFLMSNNMEMPDFMLPSYVRQQENLLKAPHPQRVCMFLNHVAGLGCKRAASECQYAHVCVLCGKNNHGAHMVTSAGMYMCQVHREYEEGMIILAKELLERNYEDVAPGLYRSYRLMGGTTIDAEVYRIVGAAVDAAVIRYDRANNALLFNKTSEAEIEQRLSRRTASQQASTSPPWQQLPVPAAHLSMSSDSNSSTALTAASTTPPTPPTASGGGDPAERDDFEETTDVPNGYNGVRDSEDSDSENEDHTEYSFALPDDDDDDEGYSRTLFYTFDTENRLGVPNDSLGSSVYKGEVEELGNRVAVAIKRFRLPSEKVSYKAAKKRFQTETRRLQDLIRNGVSCVVPIREVVPSIRFEGCKFGLMVMQRCSEGDLGVFIEGNKDSMNSYLIRDFAIQLVRAYRTIHRDHICHIDVKPANILIHKSRDHTYRLLLCDFAISHRIEGQITSSVIPQAPLPTHVLGHTVSCEGIWSAPEVFNKINNLSTERPTVSCDLWALGNVLYFLGTKGECLIRPRDLEGFQGFTNKAAVEEVVRQRLELLVPSEPLLADLVQQLATYDPRMRLHLGRAVSHPALWTQDKIKAFVTDCWTNLKDQMVRELDKSSALIIDNDGGTWVPKLESAFPDISRLKSWRHVKQLHDKGEGGFDTAGSLLRTFRNSIAHVDNLRFTHGDEPTHRIIDIFVRTFPRLLIVLHEVMLQFGTFVDSDINGLTYKTTVQPVV